MGISESTLEISVDEDRYSRLKLISWWDQEKIKNAHVLVVGAGAIGNEIIKNLALLGVGNIYIIDLDRIENTNLSRSILFRKSDITRFKAEIAALCAKEINDDVRVKYIVGNVITDLGLGFFRRMNVVLGGLDNREARLAINQYCFRVGVPWIDGAIEVLNGVARVFSPDIGACYECTMTSLDWKLLNKRMSCALLSHEQMLEGKTPTTPTSSSIIAAIQVQEMLKLIHGDRNLPNLISKGFVFNGITHDSYVVEYDKKDECMSHDKIPSVQVTSWSTKDGIAEVLNVVRMRHGPTSCLILDREIITETRCSCGNKHNPLIPVKKAKFADIQCTKCGNKMDFDTTHVIDDSFVGLDKSFNEIGIPPLHIIQVHAQGSDIYYEFSADQKVTLN